MKTETADEELAYLAGLIASDGHICDHCGVIVSTNNQIFVSLTKEILERVSSTPVSVKKMRTATVVSTWDRNLLRILHERFSIPKGNKSLILTPPDNLDETQLRNFIRGFCDGDSSIHTRRMRNKIVPRIRIMSICKEMLEWIRESLIALGIRCGSVFVDEPHGFGKNICYRIEIYGNSVTKFREIIGYLHPEKREKIIALTN